MTPTAIIHQPAQDLAAWLPYQQNRRSQSVNSPSQASADAQELLSDFLPPSPYQQECFFQHQPSWQTIGIPRYKAFDAFEMFAI